MKMLKPRASMGPGPEPTGTELLSTGPGCCYLNGGNLRVAYMQLDFLNIAFKYYLGSAVKSIC